MSTPQYIAAGRGDNRGIRAIFGETTTASIYLKEGETVQYGSTVLPEQTHSMPFTFWRSSDPSSVYVDQDGNITIKTKPDSSAVVTLTTETMYNTTTAITFSVNIEDFTYRHDGVDLNYVILSETAKTCGVTRPLSDTITKVTIPEKVKNGTTEYTVTQIRDNAFQNCNSLTEVTLPESLLVIRSRAFIETPLKSIVIPNSVTTINLAAFCRCSNLTSVKFGNSLVTIGNSAFQQCEKLSSIELPNTVTSIGTYAFSRCTSAVSLTLPNGLKTLQQAVFSGCTSLTQLVLPPSVVTIGETAFNGCTGLKRVYMGPNVTGIGKQAFYNTNPEVL